MDLSTTSRRPAENVAELQKTRVAKSVFSIRSLVNVDETTNTISGKDRVFEEEESNLRDTPTAPIILLFTWSLHEYILYELCGFLATSTLKFILLKLRFREWYI
ncbi:PREDICTED: uncharacterized protein LOC105366786 [Ceratosolen solmsi marchali]|uniref:Uncharacterized protein LOC105366786 n=1 Tax=Ceratosolen solmsi marchali TaxID=326594 RepID=A0AAJ7E0X5_9HYME|nr:PREDICTED: uncharacterized protein LOC105366786 [Ceratosolen solmsi marchali]